MGEATGPVAPLTLTVEDVLSDVAARLDGMQFALGEAVDALGRIYPDEQRRNVAILTALSRFADAEREVIEVRRALTEAAAAQTDAATARTREELIAARRARLSSVPARPGRHRRVDGEHPILNLVQDDAGEG